MRLKGPSKSKGRVEVYFNNAWRSVCSDLWDIRDARVVCRALGYHDAVRATSSGEFLAATGGILLTDVQCSGNESGIFECDHKGVGNSYCYQYQAAGVECEGKCHTVKILSNTVKYCQNTVKNVDPPPPPSLLKTLFNIVETRLKLCSLTQPV